jgi:hypothetical protein
MSTLGTLAAKYMEESAPSQTKAGVFNKVATAGMNLTGGLSSAFKKISSRNNPTSQRRKRIAKRERDSFDDPFANVVNKSTITNNTFSSFDKMGFGLFKSFIDFSKRIIKSIQQAAINAFKKVEQLTTFTSPKQQKITAEKIQGIPQFGETAEARREKSLADEDFKYALIEKLDEITDLLKKLTGKSNDAGGFGDMLKGAISGLLLAKFGKLLKPIYAILNKIPVLNKLVPASVKAEIAAAKTAKAAGASAKTGGVAVTAASKVKDMLNIGKDLRYTGTGIAAEMGTDAAKVATEGAEVAAKGGASAAKVATEGAEVAAKGGASAAKVATEGAEVAAKAGSRGLSRFLGPISLLIDAGIGAYSINEFVNLLNQRETKQISDEEFEQQGKEHWVEIVRSLGYPTIGAILGSVFPGVGTLAGGVVGSTIGALDWGTEWLTGWSPAKGLGEYIFESFYMGDNSKAKEIESEIQKNNEAISKKEQQASGIASTAATSPAASMMSSATVGAPTNIPTPEGFASSVASIPEPITSPISSSSMTSDAAQLQSSNQPSDEQIKMYTMTRDAGFDWIYDKEDADILAQYSPQQQLPQQKTTQPTIVNNYYYNTVAGGGSGSVETSMPFSQPSESVLNAMLSADAHGARMGINS